MELWSYLALMVVILAGLFLALSIQGLMDLASIIRDTLFSTHIFNNIAGSLGTLRDIALSVLEILLILAFIYLLYLLWRWVQEEAGVFIQPFVIGTCNDKYIGSAISDMLMAELLKIQSIYATAKEIEEIRQANLSKKTIPLSEQARSAVRSNNAISSSVSDGILVSMELGADTFTLPDIIPSSMNLVYNVSSSISVSGGQITVSIDQILILLKKISGHSERLITGSIQEYGSTIALIAWMGIPKIKTWEVKRESKDANIQDMVCELAFKIARDITEKDIKAKTWRGLKFYTEALNEYNRYNICGAIERLSRAHELCLKAVNAERGYMQPVWLLYNIGIEYILIKKYPEAEHSFNEAIRVISGARDSAL